MKISYKWLKKYIPEIPNEEELANLITFKICELEEVEKLPNGDTVFDMKILPDRAHDLLSHRGVAKEIAGILGLKMVSDSLCNSFAQVLGRGGWEPVPDHSQKNNTSESETSDHLEKNSISKFVENTNLKIKIESPLCKRYMGRIVRDIEISSSPKWLVEVLESIGQRSINNIVDITNFILFDMGQPIHAFDLDKLESPNIFIRNAKLAESIDLLGYENIGGIQKRRGVILNESNLIIADMKDPVAIAGVKGGTKAEVDPNTKNILIEVANFDPVSVRKTARKFGIQTDAVKRYENEITPNLCGDVMEEVSDLIKEVCPNAVFEDVVDVYTNKSEEKRVQFTTAYISKVLGKEIKDEKIEKILKNYNYNFSHTPHMWELVVPDNRLDITGGHDMAEEIGRVYGYEKIEPKIPELNFNHKDNDIWSKICLAKNKLISLGYREVFTYTFTNKGEVEVLASASDKNFLRTNILDGLTKSYEVNRLNSPLLDLNEIKIFEIGTIFTNKGEEIHVAYLDKKNKVEMSLDDFIKKENITENFLHNSFQEVLGRGEWEPVPDHSQKNDASKFSEEAESKKQKVEFKMWSLYPFISRDVAVWVPENYDGLSILDILKDNAGELLIKEPYLFDKFTKGDRTSYAYRLVFQSLERTLKDEEVEEIMQKIYQKLKDLGLEIR